MTCYCKLCGCYIGLLTFQSFCEECSNIRRLILLHSPKKMYEFMRKELLNSIIERPLEDNINKNTLDENKRLRKNNSQ